MADGTIRVLQHFPLWGHDRRADFDFLKRLRRIIGKKRLIKVNKTRNRTYGQYGNKNILGFDISVSDTQMMKLP
jgi:hypothetical protein